MTLHLTRIHRVRQAAAHRAALGVGLLLSVLAPCFASTPAYAADHGPSGGCGKQAATGIFNLTTEDGIGRSRTYMLKVPADYRPSHAYSLSFVFHGRAGSPAHSFSWGLQKAAGAAENGIFVFPNGIDYQQDGIGWDDSNTGYDIPFFDHMLEDIEGAYCIDTDEIFVAGFSWGGDFTLALACNRGDVIRAVEVNSASDDFKDKSNFMTYLGLPCPTHAHPRVRFEHAAGSDPAYAAPEFATTSKFLKYLNSCGSASSNASSSTPAKVCATYHGCASQYLECIFDHRIGHALPPDWAEDTWTFFTDPGIGWPGYTRIRPDTAP